MIGIAYRVGATGAWRATAPIRHKQDAERQETELRESGFIAFALPYWLCKILLRGVQRWHTSQLLAMRENVLSED